MTRYDEYICINPKDKRGKGGGGVTPFSILLRVDAHAFTYMRKLYIRHSYVCLFHAIKRMKKVVDHIM